LALLAGTCLGPYEILAPLGLAPVYATMGNRAGAQRIVQQVDELSGHLYVEPFWRSLLHLGLGQQERALECLEQMAEDHNPSVSFLSDPRLDPVCAEPRFQQLLRRLRL
jgi:hypothetical protein